MRYYEIAQRPETPTATDQIMRDERHLQHGDRANLAEWQKFAGVW